MSNEKKIEKLREKQRLAYEEYWSAMDETIDKEMEWHEVEKHLRPSVTKIKEIEQQIDILTPVEFKDIPDYGDPMPIDAWIECVRDGFFIDYDGHGYLATETQMSNVRIYPSDFAKSWFLEKAGKGEFTHVIWFNR